MVPELFYTTRRDFLRQTFTVVSAAATLPAFIGHTARLLAATQPAGARRRDASGRVLVIVQLAGGNDGLNMVVPYGAPEYYRARPQLAVAERDVLRLKDGIGLHPAATGLKDLFDAGRLAIVQGVGYPNPNRSHFSSTDIWMTGDPQRRQTTGWVGRYFDACCQGTDPLPSSSAIALTGESPLTLQGARFAPLAFNNPAALAWQAGRRDAAAQQAFERLNNRAGADAALPMDGPALAQFLERAALEAQAGADEVRRATGAVGGPGPRGGGAGAPGGGGRGAGSLDGALRLVLQLMRSDLPTRVYYVTLGGFDTHSGQAGRHRALMQQLGDGLKSFVDALAADDLLDRTLIMTFSEFGRRVTENASGGTDHGAAAPLLLAGGGVEAGLHGDHPNLSQLDHGDLAWKCDFRQVYAAVLDDWLGVKSKDVLGGQYLPLRVLRSRT